MSEQTTPGNLDGYISAHERLFAHYDDLCERIGSNELATQSLCPDWSVRDVIGHAIGVERVLDLWAPSAEDPPPFARMGEFAGEVRDLAPGELARRVSEVTGSRLEHLRSLDAGVVDQPSITPVGVHTYGRFLRIRVFDLWVHARDMAVPLGEVVDDSAIDTEMALDEVSASMGYIVGKLVGMPEGSSIVFHLSGGRPRDIAVVVDGRAAVVDSVPSPTVQIDTDLTTFMLLAAGRIDPQGPIDDERITWRGDRTWGERAARNLAFTM